METRNQSTLDRAAGPLLFRPQLSRSLLAGFGWAFLKERPGRTRCLSYGAILVGLVTAGAAVRGMPDPAGLAALVLAAAMWAAYTLLFRRSGLTPIQSAALLLPAYGLLGLSRFHLASAGEIALQAVYQGVLMSAVAIVTFNRAVALRGAPAATAIIALVPAVAAALAIPFLGEVPTPIETLAIAAIVIGVLLAAKPMPVRRRAPRSWN